MAVKLRLLDRLAADRKALLTAGSTSWREALLRICPMKDCGRDAPGCATFERASWFAGKEGRMVAGAMHLGFLTVFPEANGYVGGYLITNSWGRPVEFRLSTAVQPNRIQQILYGRTMPEYLCADLIGKTLIDKSSTPVQLLFTDNITVLPLRTRIETPVLAVLQCDDADTAVISESQYATLTHPNSSARLYCAARYAHDLDHVREVLDRLDGGVDVSEPFTRIREAMAEARKMGVTNRG